MMSMQPALPDTVAIALPPGWTDVPLEPDQQRTFIDAITDAAPADRTLTPAERRQIEMLVAQLAQLAVSQNVIIAASYIAPEQDGELVAAGLVISTIDRRSLGTDIPLTPDVLVAGMSGFERREDGFAFDEIEPPKVVSVGSNRAVKLVRLVTFSDRLERELKQYEQSYLIPVAQGDGLVIAHFSTINFEYARQFSDLFEKIVATLRILHPGDPTFDDSDPTEGQPGAVA